MSGSAEFNFDALRNKQRLDDHEIKFLEEGLGYTFEDKMILEESLCHSSFAKEYGLSYNNERLEFLGDAVLEFIVTRTLFRTYPDANEGELTQMRAGLVKADSLFKKADYLRIPYVLLHGHTMKSGNLPKSVVANALEAVIGAVCLDGGMSAAERVVKKLFLSDSEEQFVERDPKTALQLWLQARGMPLPKYELLKTEGPSHAPTFTVRLYMNGFEHVEKGTSRKGAEAKVAALILQDLRRKFGD
ncbi:MAG: ribonuclease III [Synergistaceae bacterium]|nr:ribonuclease III [Synergistaceae bacterium]MBQ3586311.1 ribonuclease III [Synergistaceae bacterium]MBQ6002834.1 ribonuclease III [Synergistaceae bacterium]MBR0168276.1 ribonuclease III [Synergistaceae bacterium]